MIIETEKAKTQTYLFIQIKTYSDICNTLQAIGFEYSLQTPN